MTMKDAFFGGGGFAILDSFRSNSTLLTAINLSRNGIGSNTAYYLLLSMLFLTIYKRKQSPNWKDIYLNSCVQNFLLLRILSLFFEFSIIFLCRRECSCRDQSRSATSKTSALQLQQPVRGATRYATTQTPKASRYKSRRITKTVQLQNPARLHERDKVPIRKPRRLPPQVKVSGR